MADVTITATTPGPCGCCAPPVPPDCFRVRQKYGSSNACGFLRPDGNWYRDVALTGNVYWCWYSDGSCTIQSQSTQVDYSGGCSFSAVDCTEMITGLAQFLSSGLPGCPPATVPGSSFSVCDLNVNPGAWPITSWPPGITLNQTILADTLVADGLCYPWLGGSVIAASTATATYSNQDTAADIYARAVAAESIAPWFPWTPVIPGSPGQYAVNIEASPTSQFGEQQWKIQTTGMVPGRTYHGHVQIFRSVDGLIWVLYQTLAVSGTADGAGNLLITGNTPNDLGYYTYANSDCILT